MHPAPESRLQRDQVVGQGSTDSLEKCIESNRKEMEKY